jgi:intracellular sulfur oxidation DsrE/DsrF family protein
MKKLIQSLLIATGILFIKPAMAQTFEGAPATKDHYKAIYMLDDADPKKMDHTLKNIDNALEDPRLKGKLDVELIVFGEGVAVYQKTGTYEGSLLALQKKGVILAMCSNTMKMRHIDKESLFPFVNYVPSANGEIIIRQADGWAVIHP